jgi:hypothetical protein
MPVVACGLHSQVGVVCAAIGSHRPGTRVAYVMTDAAALPIAMSDLVVDLRSAGLIHTTITSGQAFGGDLEATTVPSALLLARRAGAEVTVVGMGPGVVGTGSSYGTTAVEVAPILDTAAALDATPVLCARWSDADPRERHRGLSHHTVVAASLLRSTVQVPVPAGRSLDQIVPLHRHQVTEVEVPDTVGLLTSTGVTITTMGRGPDDDPGFFAFAAAAGIHAARLASTLPGR